MPDVIFNGPEGRLEGRYQHSRTANAPVALAERVRATPGRLGSKEFLWLFRSLLGDVLETGTVGELGDARLTQLLAGGGLS